LLRNRNLNIFSLGLHETVMYKCDVAKRNNMMLTRQTSVAMVTGEH